jgi:hypothetical protein
MMGLALIARAVLASQLAAASTTAPDQKVIVKLECRHETISVVATRDGVRYSASDKTGKLLVNAVTLDTLKSDHPQIYKQVAPTVCARELKTTAYAGVE